MGLYRSSFIWLVHITHFTLYKFSNLCCYLLLFFFWLYSVLYLWSIFPNMFKTPQDICGSFFPPISPSGRWAFSIDDEHDDDSDGGIVSCPALYPSHYLLSIATTPTKRLKNSWMLQPNVTFTLGNMWHCWQFLPTSQICSPWLLWCVFLAFLQSLWTCKFSYVLGIPIWRAPHYIKIKPKLLTGVHKAIYDLLAVHLFDPISHHHHLIRWPQTPCPTFGSQYVLPLHLACWIPIHWWTSLPPSQMWDRHPPCVYLLQAGMPPDCIIRPSVAVGSVCPTCVLLRAIIQHLTQE